MLPQITSQLLQRLIAGFLQLINSFQHVHCRWNNFEIISEILAAEINSASDVVTCEIRHWNNFKIISKLFYFTCNHTIKHIQIARAVVKAKKFSHASPIVKSLHCLTIIERIEYKLLSVTYKVFTTSQPTCLSESLSNPHPRSTRSSTIVTLLRIFVSSSLKITNRSFRYSSLHLWNQLTHSLRQPHQTDLISVSLTEIIRSVLSSFTIFTPIIIYHSILFQFSLQTWNLSFP